MKSVFYIVTIHKIRYIGLIEVAGSLVACKSNDGFFQVIKDGMVVRQRNNLTEAIKDAQEVP